MLLRKVSIKGFRCFCGIEVELEDGTTVLIGENNTGKTSFLDAINLCMSRATTRRGGGPAGNDYHLGNESAQPGEAGALAIALDFVLDEQEPDELVQELGDAIVFDDESTRHIILRMESCFDPGLVDFHTDVSFLDAKLSPLGPKSRRPQLLSAFLQLMPVFYLSAGRDITREFGGRSAFWTPFLRVSGMPKDVREHLQAQIGELNNQVVSAHAPLQGVKTHLAKAQQVVPSEKGGIVDIEALPARIQDLLNRAQVNITTPTGAPLPLAHHGSGTQSLAVIFLFEAFFATMLSQEYHALSQPLLALEEPEAHLHPCAIRSLWTSLCSIAGQKIITTHSGDLLSQVPLAAVRRFSRRGGQVVVRRVHPGTLTPDEQRKVDFHLRSCRGELLFARCWLLGEGESEYWAFRAAADVLGHDFDRLGVRFVSTSPSGVEPLLKVATDLAIGWYHVGDGDSAGVKNEELCHKYLEGRDPVTRMFTLPERNIEVLLCKCGLGHVFEKYVSNQKKHTITASKDAPEYWGQVVDAQPNGGKPARIQEVMFEMRARGASAVPAALRTVTEAAVAVAKEQA